MKLTQEELKEVLHYNPDTGIFTWKVDRGNRYKAKSIAGNLNNGYRRIKIYGIQILAHRLAFLYMEGYLPEHQVDHINRVGDDNRWCNLRHVSQSCNLRNCGNQSNNKSGVKGVSWHNKSKKWTVCIYTNNKVYNLGYLKDFEEAVCHRLAIEQCLNWSSCAGDSPAFQYVQNMLGEINE